MPSDQETRAEYNSRVAKAREQLYRGAMSQLKKAMEHGYFIEAVSLCESVISDRLAARLSFLNNHSPESRRVRNFGPLIKYLRSIESPTKFPELTEIYTAIEGWRSRRNRSIHNSAKLHDGDVFEGWLARYREIEAAALEGVELQKELDRELKRLKKQGLKKTSSSTR